MANEFFSRTSPTRDFELVQNAFDKLPALAGNANEVVVVNAGATALTSMTEATFNASIHTELDAIQDSLAGYITGCTPSNGADATNDIDFSAGFIFDGTRGYTVGAKTKRADATFAAGSAAGGMAAAVVAGAGFTTTTDYHCFALLNPSTGTTDYGFDTSVTAANLLVDAAVVAAGFTVAKRVSTLRTGGSAAWPLFTARQIALGLIRYLLKTPVFDLAKNWAGADDTAQTGTLAFVPGGIKVNALLGVQFIDASASAQSALLITSLDQSDTAADPAAGSYVGSLSISGSGGSAARASGIVPVLTSTDRTFRYRANGSTADHFADFSVHGWEDSIL